VHERQRHELGEAARVVLQPASSCRCATQWAGWSTWPYIIVLVVGMPSRCAVVTTSTHEAVGSLPFVSTQRTSSSRISRRARQAVDPRLAPATRNSAIDSRERAAPLTTSIGLYACRCRPGRGGFTARARSRYAVPGSCGSMPPCMQTSVAPTSHASRARSADLVERERVGVGVGAPLGEGAEPAAGVADVGEVDVAVHDVGDLVADRVAADVVGEGAHRVEVGAVGRDQRQGLRRRQGRRAVARHPQRGGDVAVGAGTGHRPGTASRTADQSP
jgi:hypothetical protein